MKEETIGNLRDQIKKLKKELDYIREDRRDLKMQVMRYKRTLRPSIGCISVEDHESLKRVCEQHAYTIDMYRTYFEELLRAGKIIHRK
jgi:regulator of replication initiation timing